MSSVSSLNSLLSSTTASSSTTAPDISTLLAAATGATTPGIDVTSAVDAAIYAAQAPERQWQAQQTTLQSQMTALGSIQTAMTAVSSDLTGLNDPEGALAARAVSSSNSSLATATASAGATVGTHVLTVTNLATSSTWYSAPVTSSTASLGSSSLTITQADGTQTNFAVGAGANSLTALASAINAGSLGITASVVNDSTGSRLALVSQTTGAGANFTVSDGAATAANWTSASVASSASPLAAGTYQIGDGTSTAAITVNAGSTLTQVASQINAQGLNLTASVVSDASGAHLSITSPQGNVTVSSDPALTFTQASVARDASLTVDGIPVTSSSNTVTGALSGVTLNLQGASAGTQITLGVTADATQIGSALSQFVTDYNTAMSQVSSQFTYSSTSQGQGALGSDATVRSLQSALLNLGSYTAGSSTNSSVSTLAGLGITMNDDGSLSLNTNQLDQTVAADPSGVQNFFQGTALNGFAQTASSQLSTFSDPANGVLTVDLNSMTQEYNALQTDVNNYESGYIASQKTVLTAMYSNAEIALQQLPTTLKQLQAELGNTTGS